MSRPGLFWIHRFCLLAWLAAVLPASAQQLDQRAGGLTLGQPGALPAWAVPVLRLVSATHVEPTTGIVLSDGGLVLVPEDFAGMGDEIIVLDGGTDIIRNGRPARIERKFTAAGLQLLMVDGLERPGVTLSGAAPGDGGEVLLKAFPPAELIAQGEPPLNLAATLVVFAENDQPAVSGETPLPNVTGALVDGCGYLEGVSLADDIQTMEPSPATRYRWRETLLRILEQMQIMPRQAECGGDEPPEPEPAAEEPKPEEEPIPEEPTVEDAPAVPVDEAPEAAEPTEPEPAGEEPALDLEVLPPIEKGPATDLPPPEEPASSGWFWLLAGLVLIGLGLSIHRLRRPREATPMESNDSAAPPLPLVETGDEAPAAPEPLLDSLLVVHGALADGTAFETACRVSENAINVLIGRGDADLVIDSPAVSRQHASLNGSADELTLADLGSSNGTSINGVPCLEDEIMFVEPGDVILLGDARCTIELRPARGDTGSS